MPGGRTDSTRGGLRQRVKDERCDGHILHGHPREVCHRDLVLALERGRLAPDPRRPHSC